MGPWEDPSDGCALEELLPDGVTRDDGRDDDLFGHAAGRRSKHSDVDHRAWITELEVDFGDLSQDAMVGIRQDLVRFTGSSGHGASFGSFQGMVVLYIIYTKKSTRRRLFKSMFTS